MSEYIIEVQAGASQGVLAVAVSSVITRTSNNIWRLTLKRSQNDKWVQIFCGSSILQSSSLKMKRKCQQSCCKNPKNKSNFWLKLKDMLQINPEKRYLTPQLMFLPPSMGSITKTLPIAFYLFIYFLSFCVWQRNDGYYLPKWLTAINNDAAAVFVPLQDWGVRVCSGSPESVCDETCFEVRGDGVGAAAYPHLLPLMELSQPICPRPQTQDALQIWDMFHFTQMTSAFTWSCVIFISCHVFLRPSKAIGAEIGRIVWLNPHKAVVNALKWGSAHSIQNPVWGLPDNNRVSLFLVPGPRSLH